MDKEELFEKIDKEYLSQIKNTQVVHEKLLICFSGMPFSGKSALAKKIEERYEGLRIESDKPRYIIFTEGKPASVEEGENSVGEYKDKVFKWVLTQKNGLVINDASIDRSFKKVLSWAKDNDYQTYIITMNTKLEIIEKGIENNKFGQEKDWFFKQIERWQNDFENFNKNVKADFVIRNNSLEDEEGLFQELDKIII